MYSGHFKPYAMIKYTNSQINDLIDEHIHSERDRKNTERQIYQRLYLF